MMKEIKIGQETIVEIQKKVKGFSNNQKKLFNQLSDVSWVAKMMNCSQDVVKDIFEKAAHDFVDELTDEGMKGVVLAYAEGMDKCRGRLDKGTNAFDRMRKFVTGVTNCFYDAVKQDRNKITDKDKLMTAWMIRLINDKAIKSQKQKPDASSKADTFTAQSPKSEPQNNSGNPNDKPEEKTPVEPVKPTLISKWVDKVNAMNSSDPQDTITMRNYCSEELCMYICSRDSNDATTEVFDRAPEEVRPVSEHLASMITSKSSIVHDVITRTNGFVGQMCEILNLTGYKGEIKLTGLTYEDSCDSYSYEYERPRSIVQTVLDSKYGGNVLEYIKGLAG